LILKIVVCLWQFKLNSVGTKCPRSGFDFRRYIPCVPPSSAGNPEVAAHWGRLFFGYFHFGEAKESD
jgi:hypothetical protein